MVFGILLFTGASLIILGFLVKKYPNLIAGYNTMSARDKAKVDIDGLSTMMRNTFIILGVLVALSYPLMALFVLEQHVLGAVITISIFGCFIMVLLAQTFKDRTQKSKKIKTVRIVFIAFIFIALATLIFGFLWYGTKAPDISISSNKISVTGLYATSVKVKSIELVDSIPKILLRTNGFSYGGILKGSFKLEEYGVSKLFLLAIKGPYIVVKTDAKKLIIINRQSKEETQDLFTKLRSEFVK